MNALFFGRRRQDVRAATIRRSWTLLIALFPLVSGCSPQLTAEEARILEIAKRAVAENDTWIDRAEFETPFQRPDGSWRVYVQRTPIETGGHRTIVIDKIGNVTRYIRGR